MFLCSHLDGKETPGRHTRSSSGGPSSSSGRGKSRLGVAAGGVSKSSGCKRRLSSAATGRQLQLNQHICDGFSGPVVAGSYGGQPAVFKLFGPDRAGLAAGCNESSMYGKCGCTALYRA